MLCRTPYSSQPYGDDKYRSDLGPSSLFGKDGYIVVYQDVRGRWMSEGEFVNMRPYLPKKTSPKDIDESSDTFRHDRMAGQERARQQWHESGCGGSPIRAFMWTRG